MKPNVNINVADTIQSIGVVAVMLLSSGIFAWWEYTHPSEVAAVVACYTACGKQGGAVVPVDNGTIQACICYPPPPPKDDE